MTGTVEEDDSAAGDPDALREAMRRLMGNFPAASPEKAERKRREKKARSLVDGRTLRSKGRTAQLNVKVRPDIKETLAAQAAAKGIGITDLLERMVEEMREPKGG